MYIKGALHFKKISRADTFNCYPKGDVVLHPLMPLDNKTLVYFGFDFGH